MYPIDRLRDIRALNLFLGIPDGDIHQMPYRSPVTAKEEPETGEVLFGWRFNPDTWEMEIVHDEPKPTPA